MIFVANAAHREEQYQKNVVLNAAAANHTAMKQYLSAAIIRYSLKEDCRDLLAATATALNRPLKPLLNRLKAPCLVGSVSSK